MSAGAEPVGAGVPETAERDGAFPRLDDDQRARFRELGKVRDVEPGDVLFAAGDISGDFFIIESGALGLLTGQRLYLTGVVRDPGQVIQVPVETLRQIVAEDKTLSDVILGAFIARRAILIDVGTGIKLIGS